MINYLINNRLEVSAVPNLRQRERHGVKTPSSISTDLGSPNDDFLSA